MAVLSRLSEAAEERPVLCLVDEAQWLDRSSAEALGFAARRRGETRAHLRNPQEILRRLGATPGPTGLVQLDLLAVVAGVALAQTAKAWFLDRMVLLLEGRKTRDLSYAAWER